VNLNPSTSVLQQALGEGAGSPDYLHDLDDSDATGLNSRKWKFAAFFNRMKSLVRGEWHPDQLLQRHDPTGHIYGAKDRVTVLKVELKLDGRVQDVNVKQSSGVEFLDDEAMSAFRRAQPFENAPQPLADPDGIIRFSFAFVVQLSGKTSIRWYRE
jgi:TonB family protein